MLYKKLMTPARLGPSRLTVGGKLRAIINIYAPSHRQILYLQFGIYLIVGGICFSIDITGFLILRYLGIWLLAASALSFVTATIANYFLCCTFVFRRGRFSRQKELCRLFCIAIVGLSLNSAVVWCLAEVLDFNPTLAKILAVLPVLAWNYLGRRALVFDGGPSAAAVMVAERMRERLQ